jgi:hypothetical protein
MPDNANSGKRTVAYALFASCAIISLVAVLVYQRVIIDIANPIRSIIVGVLALTAILDAIMGWRFLSAATE